MSSGVLSDQIATSAYIKVQVGAAFVRPLTLSSLLSSDPNWWPGVRLEVNRVPEGEMPPVMAFDRHLISANLGSEPFRRCWRSEGREHSVIFAPGNVGLISRQDVAGMRFTQSHDLLVLGIDDTRLNQVLEEELAGRSAEFDIVPSAEDPALFRLLRLLQQDAELGCPEGRLFGESVTNAIICHALPRYGTIKPVLKSHRRGLSPAHLRRVLEYIDAHLDMGLGIPELAFVTGMSQYHFAKLFQRSTGRTIHQFVLDLRIERARALIERGNVSLAAVGARVGLPNPCHFSATFRRRAGVTPREYGRLHGNARTA